VLKEELEEISKNGFKEIVLVGINLSCYGLDINADFAQAVELACSFDGIQRVRLGSLEPEDITDDVIKRLARLPKLCPSFHISLQSGSDSTLKRMNRHYTTQDYQNLCDKIKAHFKDASFTTDVMVGFPHETDEDFVDSLKFVKTIGFHKVHVFPYSARSGTKAAQEPQIPKAVKDTRRRKMIELADEMKSEYLRSLTGKTFSVLFETGSQNVYHGYTKSYIPVKVISTKNISDHIERVKITGCDDECCTGEIVDEMARI
jgi:threonylcarbamoyladenosine tRNA methylthiotransferase MtaB